jgi:2-polyprenyl-6-methoxyphenol hydroxylase-like FAD-dependent oxidoreductase
MDILISGAGIAGPSLALWLGALGHRVTVVEKAPGPRIGGSAVDFRGDQMTLLDRMGLLPGVRELQTAMGERRAVDSDGRRLATFPSAFFSGEVEIDREDLAHLLYERTRNDTEYVFGDSITGLGETGGGVDVTFASGSPRRFDLVIGADGAHSGVRRLAFGDESLFAHDLGFCTATFEVPNTFGLDHRAVSYNEPGRGVEVSSARHPERASVSLTFTTGPDTGERFTLEEQRELLTTRFGGMGWQVPELLEGLCRAPSLYFDRLAQIRLDRWHSGRIVLLGDAAWCAGPGGNGTGLAMLGAYTLAGELAAAEGDHTVAFARYERALRASVVKSQKQAAGSGRFLAPASDGKIRRRNRTYRILCSPLLQPVFTWMITRTAQTGALADYPLPVAAADAAGRSA